MRFAVSFVPAGSVVPTPLRAQYSGNENGSNRVSM